MYTDQYQYTQRKLVDDCEIDEAKQHIQDYQQAIDDFSQKMRARFPLNQSLLPDGTPHPLRGETITFVMKWVPESVSLDDIENLQTYAFGSLFENVNVIKMGPGNSVIITCSFPFELTGLLMAEAMKNLKLLKKKGLLKLTIGYCTIWNIRDEVHVTITHIIIYSICINRKRKKRQLMYNQQMKRSPVKVNHLTIYLYYTNYRRERTRAAITGNRQTE